MKNLKRYYRLWWEYLKRSDEFQELCAWYKQKMKDPKTPVLDKFKTKKGEGAHPMIPAYGVGGFVTAYAENCRFEDWWNWKKEIIENKKNYYKGQFIQDYAELVKHHIDIFAREFEEEHRRQPTLKEFQASFPSWLHWDEASFLVVDPIVGLNTNDKMRALKEKIKTKKLNKCNIRYEELERYLKVYDLWKQVDASGNKKFTIKEIIARVGTKSQRENLDNSNVQRVFRADISALSRSYLAPFSFS